MESSAPQASPQEAAQGRPCVERRETLGSGCLAPFNGTKAKTWEALDDDQESNV